MIYVNSASSAKFIAGTKVVAAVGLILGVTSFSAMADARDESRLGTELTPAGADKGGTATGIPAWVAPGDMGPGWAAGKRRVDFFKYKSDKPAFTIDSANYSKYAEKLNPGQAQLLKSVSGYRMDVYPSRRTCGIPQFVAENTKKNVGYAKMAADGVTLEDAYTPGYPFPFPRNGAEVMWNAKLRYRGVGLDYKAQPVVVSPRKGGGDWIKVTADQSVFYPWGVKGGTTFAKSGRFEAGLYASFVTPAAMAGQAAVFTTVAGKPAEAFYYFAGQRRVRRMPSYAYDAPQIGYENQYTIDEAYVFSGALDRFDWKLVGKKEMIVPYNSFGLYDFKAKFDDVFKPEYIDAGHRRYELHRVWVVEATVRSGMRHTTPKREFYVDEDSWNLLAAVDYDAQGKVAKVREGYVIPVYETDSCDTFAFATYNVNDGRYVVDGSSVGSGSDINWIVDGKGRPNMKQEFYTADNLRAISER